MAAQAVTSVFATNILPHVRDGQHAPEVILQ
jgi:hypothetical protein